MPNRQIREAIRQSEKVALLSDAQFRLFVNLLTCADDFGRYHADSRIVRATCYPFDTHPVADVKTTLSDLDAAGVIDLYESNGKPYLQINQWRQRVRANASKFPDPCQTADSHVTDTSRSGASSLRARTLRITNNDNDNVITDNALPVDGLHNEKISSIFDHWDSASERKTRRDLPQNRRPIETLLLSGYTDEEINTVIDHKLWEWSTKKMRSARRLNAILKVDKFDGYLEIAQEWKKQPDQFERQGDDEPQPREITGGWSDGNL